MNVKQTVIAVAFGFAALGLVAGITPAAAQGAKKFPTPSVAVVDMQAILFNSDAAKNVKAQMDKLGTTFQASLQSKGEEFRKADQDLQQQRTILSPDVLQQRQRDLQQKVANAEKDVQEQRNKIGGAYDKAMLQVETTAAQIVNQIAKENGINLVVQRQAVVHSEPEMDITPEVLKRLNAKLPTVAVAVPK